ncbi:MAG: hypothetical protein ABIG89_01945 [Candidatus Woesearchaeota archaeon]
MVKFIFKPVLNPILLLMLFVVLISANVAAVKLNENYIVKSTDHEILLVGVTEDNSCIFDVDGSTLAIKEHEEGKLNNVYIWVKDAVRTHSKGADGDNYCEIIFYFIDDVSVKITSADKNTNITEGIDKVKNTLVEIKKSATGAKEMLADAKDKITDVTDKITDVKDNLTDATGKYPLCNDTNKTDRIIEKIENLTLLSGNCTSVLEKINDSPIKKTEKSIIKRFIGWFKDMFGIK